MRVLLLGAATLLASAGAASAQTIEIEDAVARVTVITENRADVAVEVQQGTSGLPPVQVSRRGNTTFIDGGLNERDIRGCSQSGFGDTRTRVNVRGVGEVAVDAAPRIIIRAPMTVELEADGAVWGSVGRTESLQLSNAGCGDWTLANVSGPLRLSVAGSGDVRAGTAGAARISVAGSGDVEIVSVANGLDVSVAGSGDVKVGRASGEIGASVAGSGDVSVGGGRARAVKARIAGSGGVLFAGEADSLSASVAGSGDVRVQRVNGPVSKSVIGSGEVIVGG